MPYSSYMSREERKIEILQMARAVAEASYHTPARTHNEARPQVFRAVTHFTCGRMAKWLDLSASNHLMGMLLELVDEDALRLTYQPYRRRAAVRERAVFCLPEFFEEQGCLFK